MENQEPKQLDTQISIEEAKKAIEKEKQQRAADFKDELQKLCEKHNCDLQVGGILIIPK